MQLLYKNIYKLLFVLLALSLVIFPQSTFSATSDIASTSITVLLVCGDGLVEGFEVCDPGGEPIYPLNVNGLSCTDFGYLSGDLGCLADCSAYDLYYCYSCGDGVKENAEECDTLDFNGQSCISFGFDSGSLICTPDCRISLSNCESSPIISGGGGGGGSSGGNSGRINGFRPGSEIAPNETRVVVRGKSYPESDVHILLDGKVIGIAKTDTLANFYFEADEIPSGVTSFGFWSEDRDGLKSTLLSLTFRVTLGAITNISGIYIAPTIDIDKKSVKKGEDVVIFGNTVPDSGINIHINSEQEFIRETNSLEDGKYEITFNTDPLEEDFHTVKALFKISVSDNVIQSGFSKSVSFYVGKIGGEPVCAEADLNGDGRVNLTDFSILLYYWGSDNECADQNQNGTVDLIDFSIMMYYWSG